MRFPEFWKKRKVYGAAGLTGAAVGVVGIGVAATLSFSPASLTWDITKDNSPSETPREEHENHPAVTHMTPPDHVRAIYMTKWVAGTPEWREQLVRLIENTELNAIIIDIKDYTGKLSFPIQHPLVEEADSSGTTIPDIREFISDLHNRGIYVIGRITVFQDPHYAEHNPAVAIQREDGSIWRDNKELAYIDPGAYEAWRYTVAIARGSYELGFDELNFDYIRFPSDGDMQDIVFPVSGDRVAEDPDFGKADVVRDFFTYLDATLADTNAPLSADLFGMVTTNYDDLNIGQVLEYAEPYFDYIAPMTYPSHYPEGFIGIANPGAHPYEVLDYSFRRAVSRMRAASSTTEKLRPWLQDFDLGADYTPDMVRAQIQAAEDNGIDSWMLWAPSNRYTSDALEPFYSQWLADRSTTESSAAAADVAQ